MTADELLVFIEANAKLGDFSFDSVGYIRSDEKMCPICWVASKLDKNPGGAKELFRAYGAILGLSTAESVLVASAADNGFGYAHCSSYNPDESQAFRQRLLKACKLEG